jgi:hypothetical protein
VNNQFFLNKIKCKCDFLKLLFSILHHIILFQFISADVYPLIHKLCPNLFCHSTETFRILNQINLLLFLKWKWYNNSVAITAVDIPKFKIWTSITARHRSIYKIILVWIENIRKKYFNVTAKMRFNCESTARYFLIFEIPLIKRALGVLNLKIYRL